MQLEQLTELTAKKKKLIEDLVEHNRKSTEIAKKIQTRINVAQKRIDLVQSGLSIESIDLARTILKIEGLYVSGGSEKEGVIEDAVNWFAEPDYKGHKSLTHTYYATKNYDRFRGQREDHAYGYGPKHGHVCFSVGLQRNVRNRELTPKERGAAIYYLTQIEKIQKVENLDEAQ